MVGGFVESFFCDIPTSQASRGKGGSPARTPESQEGIDYYFTLMCE